MAGPNGEDPINRHRGHHGGSLRNKVINGRVTKPGPSDKKKIFQDSSDDMEEQGSEVDYEDVMDSIEEEEESSSVEGDESIDKLLVEDPEALLHRFGIIARGIAVARDSPSITNESSTTQETNLDYDPDEGWRYEQVFLNQILKGRDEYTLMPTTWKMHFRGIPFPEGLFYVQTQAVSVRPRIYARTDRLEYRGAIALRRLIDLHSRIRDIRKAEKQGMMGSDANQIVKQTKRRLTDALLWADLDGDIASYKSYLPSNVKILEMGDADRLDMDLRIQDEMEDLAREWRDRLADIPEEERPIAPVLFGFVIFKHILFIVTLDAENPAAICHIPCQLNLSERNQHQWNALAIMVTVCWARDLFRRVAENIALEDGATSGKESDPDA
ncbi:hypothetical protein F5Y05DRAFT_370908 [Hypoxylon sp. FL0543]|nr:hypothetical protein F5Y05DRAFT_370908 [Hypoxylon sp. FL0543]